MDNKKTEWGKSYENRDNFLFYPEEEVIKFFSTYIMKRVGLKEYRHIIDSPIGMRVLDLGCGIGRHVIYCHDMGLDAYGIDLSDVAVQVAKGWAASKGMNEPNRKILQGDIRQLPWEDGFFNFAVSMGVLDSMPFEIAHVACVELARVMVMGGLFYCSLISGDDSNHSREYSAEDVVTMSHEKGTVQSYFNFTKIGKLFDGAFDIEQALLVRCENVIDGSCSSRYHLVLRKKYA